jgi:5'-3' exonuclease
MGIKNLNKLLKKHVPNSFKEVHLSKLQFKKVAIDTSLYIYKYKVVFGESGWFSAFLLLIACLRRNGIHCVFIYDDISKAPAEKSIERERRTEKKDDHKTRIETLKAAFTKYKETGEIDPILHVKEEVTPLKRLLLQRPSSQTESVNVQAIESRIEKMESQIVSLRKEDISLTKELFKILAIQTIQADGEAEAYASDLASSGKIDAVLSEDTDVLAHGCPLFLSKINTSNDTCTALEIDEVLEELDISLDSFVDICILCGSDYNQTIKNVGPEKALKLIRKNERIENITEYDTSVLNHVRVRELFSKKNMDVHVPYNGTPNFTELQGFLWKNNIRNYQSDGFMKVFEKEAIPVELISE